MGKIIACKISELQDGNMKKVVIDGREIVVVNVGGKYFACDDTCTHAGASLSEGTIENSIITCGWHGAQFDCTTGNLAKFPAKIIKNINDMNQTFMTLKTNLDQKDEEISRYKNGYDAIIFKNFLLRFTRVDKVIKEYIDVNKIDLNGSDYY